MLKTSVSGLFRLADLVAFALEHWLPRLTHDTTAPYTIGPTECAPACATETDGSEEAYRCPSSSTASPLRERIGHRQIKICSTRVQRHQNDVEVLDAPAGRSRSRRSSNLGRPLLPPSDRANSMVVLSRTTGPSTRMASRMAILNLPADDNGAMYWGQSERPVSGGRRRLQPTLFFLDDTCCGRSRPGQILDAEDGYYLNGTYYGEKDPSSSRRGRCRAKEERI